MPRTGEDFEVGRVHGPIKRQAMDDDDVRRWAQSHSTALPPRFKAHPELLEQNPLLLKFLMQHRRHADSPLLLVCPLEGCEVSMRGKSCPKHCTNASCPARKKTEPLLPWLHKHMGTVRALLPAHPPSIAGPSLLLITTTFPHGEQLVRLEHLASSLAGETNVLWIIVEDAASPSQAVARLLARHTLPHVVSRLA